MNQGGEMLIAEREIALANGRREIRENHSNKCFYCRKDFSNKPYLINIHHQDFLGYSRLSGRDPFDRKIAKPACPQCHLEIHIAAATITLGLMKSIPIGIVQYTLIDEAGMDRRLVNCVINDLRKIGISKKAIGYASRSITRRIILHSIVNGYYDDMEQMLEDAAQEHLQSVGSST
jgi:hypothetical protein